MTTNNSKIWDEMKILNAYKNAVKDLQPPKELRRGFYWFSGAMLEAYDDNNEFVDLIYATVKDATK